MGDCFRALGQGLYVESPEVTGRTPEPISNRQVMGPSSLSPQLAFIWFHLNVHFTVEGRGLVCLVRCLTGTQEIVCEWMNYWMSGSILKCFLFSNLLEFSSLYSLHDWLCFIMQDSSKMSPLRKFFFIQSRKTPLPISSPLPHLGLFSCNLAFMYLFVISYLFLCFLG